MFASSVWRLPAWERGQPPRRVLRAFRFKLACAVGAGHRTAIKARWERDRQRYFDHRGGRLEQRRYLDAITPPGPAVLTTIRECESGGDYSTNTGNGFYGAYQFMASTWASVGGSGLPHEAPPREQDERAARLYREMGSSPWPVCGV